MHGYDTHDVLYLNCEINDPMTGLDPRVNQYEHIVKYIKSYKFALFPFVF